jgi:hypothetical protein
VRASHEILENLADSAKSRNANAAVAMDDPIMATIAQVQQMVLQGQREHGSAAYEHLWNQAGRPLHRVTIAHYMADLQDDPADELRWDERALTAAAEVPADDPEIAPLRASLHINAAASTNSAATTRPARSSRPRRRRSRPCLNTATAAWSAPASIR